MSVVVQSLESLTGEIAARFEDHSCVYANRLLSQAQDLGSCGLVSYLADQIDVIHQEAGGCPPTHVDNNPTREWADLVQATKS